MKVCWATVIRVAVFTLLAIRAAAASHMEIHPFPFSAVRLDAHSPFARAAELNRQYVVSLDPDSMLYTFRRNAGLPAPGDPFVGSWEDPACEVRGQFMGHYLSATATLLSQIGQRMQACCIHSSPSSPQQRECAYR